MEYDNFKIISKFDSGEVSCIDEYINCLVDKSTYFYLNGQIKSIFKYKYGDIYAVKEFDRENKIMYFFTKNYQKNWVKNIRHTTHFKDYYKFKSWFDNELKKINKGE